MPNTSTPNKRDRSGTPEDSSQRNKVSKKMDINTLHQSIVDNFEKLNEKLDKISSDLSNDVASLKHKVSELEIKLNEMEQHKNNSSFMITGLPRMEESSPGIDIANKVLKKLNEHLEPADIKRLYWNNHKSGQGAFLIAVLWQEKKKSEIISKFKTVLRANNPITVESVFEISANSTLKGRQIRFKSLLTKYNATLLRQALTFRGKPFAHIWEVDGKIMVRKADGDKAKVIRTLTEITELAAME